MKEIHQKPSQNSCLSPLCCSHSAGGQCPRRKPYTATGCRDESMRKHTSSTCKWLRKQNNVSLSAASTKFNVNYHNLRNRYLKLHVPPREGHKKQCLLSGVQEAVLVAWMQLWLAQGTPITWKMLQVKVEDLIGKKPSLRWIDGFWARHKDLVYRRPSPLNMKRAAGFNPDAVTKHFKEFLKMLESYGPFKPRNTYNMDEKGAQIGGSHKSTGVKYFHCCHNGEKYRKCSSELELVTIIECVSADGMVLTPGFIFLGSFYDMAWFEDCPDPNTIS